MRIVATICVVFLHTCSTLTDNPNLFILSNAQRVFFTASYQSMYWAVPVFFMITGALLLEKDLSYSDILRRYVKRMIIVLLVFGFGFAIIKMYATTKMINFTLLCQSLVAVIEDTGFGHMWYIYVLIGIYLIMPLLSLIAKLEKSTVKGILIVLFVFDFCIPLLNKLLGMSMAFSVPIAYPLFYFIFGYYLNKYKGLGFVRSIVAIIFGVVVIVMANIFNLNPDAISSYNSPIIVLIAFGMFSLFVNLDFKNEKKCVWKIDRLCFGVYLIHPIFIQTAYRFIGCNPSQFKLYPFATCFFFVVFIGVSFISSMCMSKIKPLKKYIL